LLLARFFKIWLLALEKLKRRLNRSPTLFKELFFNALVYLPEKIIFGVYYRLILTIIYFFCVLNFELEEGPQYCLDLIVLDNPTDLKIHLESENLVNRVVRSGGFGNNIAILGLVVGFVFYVALQVISLGNLLIGTIELVTSYYRAHVPLPFAADEVCFSLEDYRPGAHLELGPPLSLTRSSSSTSLHLMNYGAQPGIKQLTNVHTRLTRTFTVPHLDEIINKELILGILMRDIRGILYESPDFNNIRIWDDNVLKLLIKSVSIRKVGGHPQWLLESILALEV